MSHIGTYSASLGQVNTDLLKQVLDIVAQQVGGTVSDSIKDYNGNTLKNWDGEPILGAIKTDKVSRGIGLTIKNGTLKFVGDNYGCENQFSKLKGEIELTYELTYKKLALVRALKEIGYEVEVNVNDFGTVFSGVRR
jgi:hypothetical protein